MPTDTALRDALARISAARPALLVPANDGGEPWQFYAVADVPGAKIDAGPHGVRCFGLRDGLLSWLLALARAEPLGVEMMWMYLGHGSHLAPCRFSLYAPGTSGPAGHEPVGQGVHAEPVVALALALASALQP